jgi:hypothetical protein
MLLRASSEQSDAALNFDAVMDGSQAIGIPWGEQLNLLVEALISGDAKAVRAACAAAEADMGADAVRDALIVAAGFNGITRVADATGIPLDAPTDAATVALRARLGIDEFEYGAKDARYA